jgi:hypothetical protein
MTGLLRAERENPLQSRSSQEYMIVNARQIGYPPGGPDRVLDLSAQPYIPVPAGAPALFSSSTSAGLQLAIGPPPRLRRAANLKTLARYGPVHLASEHYRQLLCAAYWCTKTLLPWTADQALKALSGDRGSRRCGICLAGQHAPHSGAGLLGCLCPASHLEVRQGQNTQSPGYTISL